ncbi:MAG: short-subunit dehydrogenase [Cyclobacteriaceae bacterium]|jgi:short-subunit dehydrogenase
MSIIDKNTVVWITGASSGIGEAITKEIAAKGAKLIISSRRQEELDRVKNSCQTPANVSTLIVDLSDTSALPAKAKEAEAIHGKVDILINSGGISQRDKAINTSLEVDRRLMEVNYFGSITLSKALTKGMMEKKSGHHVVITSAVGIISTPLRSAYAASKHALHGFYDALRAEHHSDGIKVTIALPGFIKTNISMNALTGDGTKQGTMDNAQANGMSAETCAHKIIRAVEKNTEEIYIGGIKEKAGIYIKRFFPGLFSRLVRKMAVT